MAELLLAVDQPQEHPRAVTQFAALRGMSTARYDIATLSSMPLGAGSLVALRFDHLRNPAPGLRAALRAGLRAGATLYVRGGAEPGTTIPTAAFIDRDLPVAAQTTARSYRLTASSLLPMTLARERSEGDFAIPGVNDLPAVFEPILVAKSGATERASIFALRCAAGAAIFDLNPDEGADDSPLLFRLADPCRRVADVGALLAVEHVTGRDMECPVAFNLTLDDRPANYDYLNEASLSRFLEYVQKRLPGAHVDFSWTPDQYHPSRRYVEIQKYFGSGFLWHGLARHVRHDTIADPEAEIARGLRLVGGIQARYGVRFQRVMIFPFERTDPGCIEVLRRQSFCAIGLSLLAPPQVADPPFLRHSVAQQTAADGLAILRRQAIERLPRDLMLAQTALGLPVLALAHPNDFALKRLPRPWARDSYHDLERVLDFAAAKSLRPLSMEQIAAQVAVLPRPGW